VSSVYEIIESLCKEREISLHKLSKESGVSYETLRELRNNTRTSVSSVIACKLAEYFNCSSILFLECGLEAEQSFGMKLRQRRISLGYTLEELAKMANISFTIIANLETGRLPHIRPEHLISLAAALNTTPNVLIGWNAGLPTRDEEIQIADQLPYLEDSDVELLASITSTMRNKKKK